MVVGLRYGMTGARSLGMGSGRVSRACFASPRSTVDVVPDGGRDELDARIHTLTLSAPAPAPDDSLKMYIII